MDSFTQKTRNKDEDTDKSISSALFVYCVSTKNDVIVVTKPIYLVFDKTALSHKKWY